MDGGRSRLPNGLSSPLCREILLIARMAGLMHDPQQGAEEIVVVVTGCDADILWNPAAEGMRADIQTTMLEVEA